jgi:hypothetical protein
MVDGCCICCENLEVMSIIVTVSLRSIETRAICETQLVVVVAAVNMLDVRSIEIGAICGTRLEAECESAWEDNTQYNADLGAHSIF